MKKPQPIRNPESATRPSGVGHLWGLRLVTLNLHFVLLMLLLLTPTMLLAQYSVDWFTIAGGGGTSTGGGYSVSGTIGQVDAGTMIGGAFSLTGGFWSAIATVQASGAPRLSVWRGGGIVKIAWAKPADGWVLESTPALSGPVPNWTAVSQAYQDDGANLYITLNAASGSAFYRLRKP